MKVRSWRLLGFDARDSEQHPQAPPMPEDIREVMLLRPEIEFPLSVDAHIWPTHFLYHPQIQHLIGICEPALINTDADCNGGLWLNLERMKTRLLESQRSATLVAIELLVPLNVVLDEFVGLIDFDPNPIILPEGAEFLGFDVADSGFWSGLSNCGYGEEERVKLRPQWRGRINDVGLLKSEQDAIEFRELSDARVPEHAPFWVYRLSRLP